MMVSLRQTRPGRACSSSQARRGGSDSYLSEKSCKLPPFREHWTVPFCVSCACLGGNATLRDAVSAHEGCWGETEAPWHAPDRRQVPAWTTA
jgi:hypothetical protein